MTHSLSIAEAKRRFSELVGRAASGEERFLIERRGRPVGAIVSTRDLARLVEAEPSVRPRGLLAALGALAEVEELDEIIEEVQRQRCHAADREFSLE